MKIPKVVENNGFLAVAIIVFALGVMAYAVGQSVGFTAGTADGYAKGYSEGSKNGWERAVEPATTKAYWQGAFDACQTVFDAVGWENIYVNPLAGGGTISRSYFCRDDGDYSRTPVFTIPYVEDTDGSN